LESKNQKRNLKTFFFWSRDQKNAENEKVKFLEINVEIR